MWGERESNPDEGSIGELGDANARRRPDRAKTGEGLAVETTSPGLSKEYVATRVLLNCCRYCCCCCYCCMVLVLNAKKTQRSRWDGE